MTVIRMGGEPKAVLVETESREGVVGNEIGRTKKEKGNRKGEVKSLPSTFACRVEVCYLKRNGWVEPQTEGPPGDGDPPGQYPQTRHIN
jgi:hypothetical protein